MWERLKALVGDPARQPRRMTDMNPEMRVAVCAILLETAEADSEVDPAEERMIREALREHFDLSADEVEELIALTQQERSQSHDLWPFTNAVARQSSPEEKRDILTMVWRVILADERLDAYEDQLARRLQQMLSVNHSLLMEAKQAARKKA